MGAEIALAASKAGALGVADAARLAGLPYPHDRKLFCRSTKKTVDMRV